jgi:hypothetical protein
VTEAAWLAATDPQAMLTSLGTAGGASERKRRLFTVACARRYRALLDCYANDPGGEAGAAARLCTGILDAAERQADGAGPPDQIHTLQLQLGQQPAELFWTLDGIARGDTTLWGRLCEDRAAPLRAEAGVDLGDLRRSLTALLCCIFGNPFRPAPAVNAAWLAWNAGAVRKLAAATYDDRLLPAGQLDPTRLGVLGDALEDAGGGPELLGHLRGAGPHVRGCWVIDLLLAKG